MPDITITLTDEQAKALESGERHPLIENIMRRLRVVQTDKQTVSEFLQSFVNSIAAHAVERERIVQAQAARKATDEIPILEARLAALKAQAQAAVKIVAEPSIK